MNCLIEPTFNSSSAAFYSESDVLSSFLEEFQDKNSHLFPSSADSCYSVPEVGTGVKRPRDLYESLYWSEDVRSIFGANRSDSNAQLPTLKAIKVEPPTKKQKCDEEDSLFSDDASSLSPGTPISDVSPLKEEPTVDVPENPVLEQTLSTISTLNEPIREAIFASLTRFADRAESGKMPLQIPDACCFSQQLDASHDYLTMQALQPPMQPPAIVKQRSPVFYSPVCSAPVPYVMNMPYLVPAVNSPPMPTQNYSTSLYCNPTAYTNIEIPTPIFSQTQPSIHV